jgi:hypothetical protein
MKRYAVLLAFGLMACSSTTSYVRSDNTTLGRVVIYRNGIAYFERTAEVKGDALHLTVPSDKIDDFLKSLTVTDLSTGLPAPVGFPNDTSGDGQTQMDVRLGGTGTHRLKLTYVTEAPSWKPSYRLVVGKGSKVDFEGWAVVDNTSGEDWERVKLGVGSSSALSFRFNLRSVRNVQRETLQSNDLFAQAPPMGGAAYGPNQAAGQPQILAEVPDSAIAEREMVAAEPMADMASGAPSAPGKSRKAAGRAPAAAKHSVPAPSNQPAVDIPRLARQIQSSNRLVVIEGYADDRDKDKTNASLDRAVKMREQLVANGIDPSRVVTRAQGEQRGQKAGVRIVDGGPAGEKKGVAAAKPSPETADPIGASHFESPTPMTIAKGTSAMISIFRSAAEGEVVYLYDPESARGQASFAFKAVRVRNPTDSVLESGPVTVFGDGRFIGEGLSDPVPARSVAFIPFALDRQIAVEQKDAERDDIQRIVSVQRGILSTQTQHVRAITYKLYNRLSEPATVYVRRTMPTGYKLVKPAAAEKLGASQLFRVVIEAHKSAEFTTEEATPVERTIDIRSAGDMAAVRAYITSAQAAEPLKSQLAKLTKIQQDIANDEQRAQTIREQMSAYRARVDELHVQIVTLRAVKTGGAIMRNLEKKMQEMSDRLSQSTISLASLEEKLLIARIGLQDGIAELTLESPAAS